MIRIKELAAVAVLLCAAVPASAVVINFDVDPMGNPVSAPTLFSNTVPLTNLYASMGVTFSGPAPLDGGAILSGGGFGVNPRSGPNFLAFNKTTTIPMQNGGLPKDPCTITFDVPILDFSIYGSGGGQAATFLVQAYDSGGNLITSTQGTNVIGQYVLLSIMNPASPISRIVLTEIGGDNAFVYDDMSFTPIPAPGALTLLGLAGLASRRRRR